MAALQLSRGHVPHGIYGQRATERSYSRLREVATVALSAGWPIVVDAAFLLRSERATFAALAAALSVPFTVFDCQAEGPLLRQRIQQRQLGAVDASEADVLVLDRLTATAEPLGVDEQAVAIVIDAARPLPAATLAGQWLAAH